MKRFGFILFFAGLIGLQSCFVAKDYVRPEEKNIVTQYSFRTDEISVDTQSMATLSWRDIFKDPILHNYISSALENNLDIRMAVQNILAAQAYMKQGKAGYLPQINGNISYAGSSPSLNSSAGANLENRGYFNQFEISGDISWEADIWGKIRSNQRALNASYLQSVSVHQAIKSNLIATIATTYYQLLALDEQKRITEATIKNRTESTETISDLKDAGQVTEVAVRQTQAQLFSAQSLLLNTEVAIKMLENTFCILLGEEPHAVNRGTLNNQQIDSTLMVGIPVQLLNNRPDVLAAEFGLISAFEMTNIARSQFYPALRIGGSAGVQSFDLANIFSPASIFANLIGSIAQPILNGRKIRTQYEVSQAHQEVALLNYRKTILNASKEVSDALFSYDANAQKESLKAKEFTAYNEAVEFSEELLTYGYANYLEVLTARENALNAQLSVVNAGLGKLTALVQLYRAVGGGWQ